MIIEIHKNKDAYSKVDLNGTSASTPESSNGVKIRRTRDGVNSDVTRPTESNSLTGDCC
jgi:hypothetical protein